jgi:hypothetical protein
MDESYIGHEDYVLGAGGIGGYFGGFLARAGQEVLLVDIDAFGAERVIGLITHASGSLIWPGQVRGFANQRPTYLGALAGKPSARNAALRAVFAPTPLSLFVAEDFADVLAMGRTFIANGMAGYQAAMLLDLQHGRRAEIDYTAGVVVRHAQRLGTPVPNIEFVWRAIRAIEGSFAR